MAIKKNYRKYAIKESDMPEVKPIFVREGLGLLSIYGDKYMTQDDIDLLNEFGMMAFSKLSRYSALFKIVQIYYAMPDQNPKKRVLYIKPLRDARGKIANDVNIPKIIPMFSEWLYADKDTKHLRFTRTVIEKIYDVDIPVEHTNSKIPLDAHGFIDILPNEYTDNQRFQVYFTTGTERGGPVLFIIYDFKYGKITDSVEYDPSTDKYMIAFEQLRNDDKTEINTTFEPIENDSPLYARIDMVVQLSIFLIGYYYYTVVDDLFYDLVKEDLPKNQLSISKTRKENDHVDTIDIFYGHNIIVTHDFGVSGHYRSQPCGPGRTERKWIWISEYEKHGYNRKAKALK